MHSDWFGQGGFPTPLAAVQYMVPSDADLSSVFVHPRNDAMKLVEWYGAEGETLRIFEVARVSRNGWGVQNAHQCPEVQLPQRELTPEEQAEYDRAQEVTRRS